jgi:hypothetical protein
MVYEKFQSYEQCDDIPETYVLVRTEGNRFRQYK